MWMKVLGFAKAFSPQIATFVLMLSTIFYDLFSFMAVLFLIIAMFGHAFYLILAGVTDIDPLQILKFDKLGSTFYSLYLMLLGKLDKPEAFNTVWASILFFAYSFLVVIILLNVLIAIVGDSYDAVLVKSTELFWISRLELIAEMSTVFDWFLCGAEGWLKRFEKHQKRLGVRFDIMLGLGDKTGKMNEKSKRIEFLIEHKKSRIATFMRVLLIPILFIVFTLGYMLYYKVILSVIIFFLKEKKDSRKDRLRANSQKFLKAVPKVMIYPMFEITRKHSDLEVLFSPQYLTRKISLVRVISTLVCLPFTITLAILTYIFSVMTFFTYLVIYAYEIIDRNFIKYTKATEELDLKVDSASSDWSGRVLDIVRRVNAITSLEATETKERPDR